MSDLRKAAEMALDAMLDIPMAERPKAQVQAIQALRQALAQPEQKPVQNMKTYEIVCPHCDKPHDWMYLKGAWVGLPSDEEILEISKDAWGRDELQYGKEDHCQFYVDFARAIEAKLKEKNT